MTLAVETAGLTKSFDGTRAVDDVALAVPTGAVYGFLGPNGAGKTTIMRLLLGLMRRDGGSVRLLGRAMPEDRRAALTHVGAFIESPSLYDHLSGAANLDLTRRLLGLSTSEVDRVLDVVDLRAHARRRVAGYSLGMKQRLALGRSLLGNPRLLLLDEPTNGLDPDGIIAMRELIRDLPAATGCTVFVSSHLLAEVEQMATHMGLMRGGRLVLQDAVGALLGNSRTIRVELDDPVRGADLLRAAGFAVAADGGFLRLACDDGAVREAAAAANRHLVAAGLAVSHLAPEVRSLEALYRDTVATESAA